MSKPQPAHQLVGRWRRLALVLDAQAAAEVEVFDGDALGLDRLDQIEQPLQRVQVGFDLRDLRADVAIDADHAQPRQRGGAAVGGQRLVVGDAELVVLQPGGDVGVGAGIDVGVDAQAHRRGAALGRRHL